MLSGDFLNHRTYHDRFSFSPFAEPFAHYPFTNRHLIMERTAALLIPAMFQFPEEAEEGGFAAYGPSLNELYLEVNLQQTVKLFRGTKVADIPVEQPTKFELVINLKTANAMGVKVPPSLLLRADKAIE